MSNKTCRDCWHFAEVRDGFVVNDDIGHCNVGVTNVARYFYDNACDQFLSKEDGLDRFMSGYRSAQKPNTSN